MKCKDLDSVANIIVSKMISISDKKRKNKKNILELFEELLPKQYIEDKTEILSLIPTKLAEKGYYIESSDPMILNKY